MPIEVDTAAAAAGADNKVELSAGALEFVSPVLGWTKGKMNAAPCKEITETKFNHKTKQLILSLRIL